MWKTTTLAAILALSEGLAAHAQSTYQILQKLTGGTHRVWVFKRFDTMLGPGQTCLRGEDVDLHADHTVAIRTCSNGKIVSSHDTWTTKNDGVDDWIIIGADQYELLFQDSDNTMILRNVSHSKTVPTTDKIYRRQKD